MSRFIAHICCQGGSDWLEELPSATTFEEAEQACMDGQEDDGTLLVCGSHYPHTIRSLRVLRVTAEHIVDLPLLRKRSLENKERVANEAADQHNRQLLAELKAEYE